MLSLRHNILLMMVFFKASFFDPCFFYYPLMTFLMILISLISVSMVSLSLWGFWFAAISRIGLFQSWIWTTRHCKRDRKWLVDFSAAKTWLVLIGSSNNCGSMDAKLMGMSLLRNHLLRCWDYLYLENWVRTLILSLLLKLPPRKLEPWIILWSFFLLKSIFISVNLLYVFT